MNREEQAKKRSRQAIEMLGSAIDVRISELTESNRQLKRKIFDLYTIFEISRNFNSVLNYQTLVDSFLLTALGQVGAASAALFLPPEGQADVFVLAKSKGLMYGAMLQEQVEIKGEAARRLHDLSKPVMVGELSEESGPAAEFSFLKYFQNGLILPLIIKSRVKGLLALSGKVSGEDFTTDDVEFLSILANQFIVALENARLYESEKNALDELRKAQRQLVLTERQAAIGELSAKIAHEVNNPLGIISNYLHLADRDLATPKEAAEHLDVVRTELDRIARIVRQLLELHQPQKAEKVPTDVVRIIKDVLALLERQLADQGIEIVRRFGRSVPKIAAAPEQLRQVFLNLIINARDFMPGGGRLITAVETTPGGLKIAITDTGPGIPTENLNRIFEPFFTTKETGSGIGLGLSVCLGIITEHGGTITARNVPENGAQFVIILPILRKRTKPGNSV